MLDLAYETFNQMAFTIPPDIISIGRFCIPVRWDHRLSPSCHDFISKVCCIVAAIRNHKLKGQISNQLVSLENIVALPCSQADTQRVAQSVRGEVDFGTEPTSTTPQRLLSLSAVFLGLQRRRDAPVRSCCQLARSPYQGQRQNVPTCVPRHHYRTSAQNACRPYSSAHTRLAASATGRRCGSSTARLRQNDGILPRFPHKHSGLLVRSP